MVVVPSHAIDENILLTASISSMHPVLLNGQRFLRSIHSSRTFISIQTIGPRRLVPTARASEVSTCVRDVCEKPPAPVASRGVSKPPSQEIRVIVTQTRSGRAVS